MTTQTERTPLRVVPHFSRLQEWIALDEGFFQAEGLEPEMLQEVMHAVSSHAGDPYGQRPQDVPFVKCACLLTTSFTLLGIFCPD